MVDKVQSYNPTTLQFSSSRLFFQNQTQLLQKLGFISPTSIDIYFKYSFQQVFDYHFIQ